MAFLFPLRSAGLIVTMSTTEPKQTCVIVIRVTHEQRCFTQQVNKMDIKLGKCEKELTGFYN